MKFLHSFILFATTTVAAHAATAFTNFGTAEANNIFVAGNWDNGLPTSANPGTINGDATFWPADTAGDGTGATTAGPNKATGISITVTSGTLSRVGDFIPEFQDSIINLQGGNLSNVGPGARVFRLSGTSVLTVGAGSTFTADASRGIELQSDGAGTPSIFMDGGTINAKTGDDLGISTTDTAYAVLTFGVNGGTVNLDALTFDTSSPYVDFVSGSAGVLDVTGADATYFENLWNAGNLRVDGANSGTFGESFSVNNTTLALVPEPSVMLLGGLGLLSIMRRRRD